MKFKNASNFIIATVVILCSLVLLGALTFALAGVQWKKGGRSLHIDFRTSTGVKLHSPVRYAGAMAGTVTGIRYLSTEERRSAKDPMSIVRVTLRLDDTVPPIPSDTTAGLAADTILGEKFIALSPGAPDAPPLPDGAIIQGQEVIAFDALARTAQSALQNVTEILAKLNQDYPTLIPKLAELLTQANSLLLRGSNFVQDADGALTNANGVVTQFRSDYPDLVARLGSILAQAQTVATNADHAILQVSALLGHADGVVQTNEENLHKIINELHVVSQNLKVITTYTKSLTGTLAEKPNRLIWGKGKTPLPSEQQILESPTPVPVERPHK